MASYFQVVGTLETRQGCICNKHGHVAPGCGHSVPLVDVEDVHSSTHPCSWWDRNHTWKKLHDVLWIVSDSTQRPHQIRLLFPFKTIVLWSDSTCILVKNCLFCIEHLLCSVGFWRMLERYCGGLINDILFWFIESQPHFGMPKGAKMKLALNKPHYVALQIQPYLKACRNFWYKSYPLTQWNLLSGVSPWWFSVGCFAYKWCWDRG